MGVHSTAYTLSDIYQYLLQIKSLKLLDYH